MAVMNQSIVRKIKGQEPEFVSDLSQQIPILKDLAREESKDSLSHPL